MGRKHDAGRLRKQKPGPAPEREHLGSLVLGHSPEGATGYPHPVTITVCPRSTLTLVNFSVGPHVVNAGGQLSVGHVVIDGMLDENFSEEFDACEARWLVPYLARLAEGEDVTELELVEAYEARYGRGPRREWSADHTH